MTSPNGHTTSGGPWLSPAAAELATVVREEVADRLETQAKHQARQGSQDALEAAGPQERAQAGRELIEEVMGRHLREAMLDGVIPPAYAEQEAATEAIYNQLFGLGALQPLLDEQGLENINVNGCDQVFVRHSDGRRERRAAVAKSDAELVELVRTAAARLGVAERRFDSGSPLLNLQLPDGSRLFAAMSVSARPWVAIRRHRHQHITLSRLQELGALDARLAQLLAAAVRARRNILISGGTGIGKTTLLRALATEIPPQERIITIEDVQELGLHRDTDAHPDAIAMEVREPNVEGHGGIDAGELVRAALRASPDRVIVGETRGPETVPFLNAMTQGNDGSMATIHASSSGGVFTRLASYAAQSEQRLGMEATALMVAGAVHLVVHLAATPDNRRVISSIREITGADGRHVISNEVFEPGPDRRAVPAAPLRAETVELLEAHGATPDVTRGTGWSP